MRVNGGVPRVQGKPVMGGEGCYGPGRKEACLKMKGRKTFSKYVVTQC